MDFVKRQTVLYKYPRAIEFAIALAEDDIGKTGGVEQYGKRRPRAERYRVNTEFNRPRVGRHARPTATGNARTGDYVSVPCNASRKARWVSADWKVEHDGAPSRLRTRPVETIAWDTMALAPFDCRRILDSVGVWPGVCSNQRWSQQRIVVGDDVGLAGLHHRQDAGCRCSRRNISCLFC